ncbi:MULTISPECIES: MFS transporter [unclassified Cryobacterium]|uniref:MFS transporter n=1 Tax=unclassified Cryobacterium TaxID=2649013 RepID=UPI001A2FFC7D
MTTVTRLKISAWRFVLTFGTVSLLADFVYEGARSITGPLLAELGATALVVGIVTGIGEAAALLLRLVSGPLADRTKRFWAWTLAGYALTVISVPTLGFSGVLWVACTLVILERIGKAVRSPANDALLSFATASTGRGRGFAVHEALDQMGAIIGPLVVAGMLALTGNDYGPSLAVLALPGVTALGLLVWLRSQARHPLDYENAPTTVNTAIGLPRASTTPAVRLPRTFWLYSVFTGITMLGFATFGVLSFHIVERGILPPALVPVLYAGVMLIDAIAALTTGWAYDRFGPGFLLFLPVIAALVPILSFTDALWPVIIGSLLWGAALGVQESTLRATIADLVPSNRRSTAYGIFAAVLGVATAGGGALTGALYGISIPTLIGVTIALQALAIIMFITSRLSRSHDHSTIEHAGE